MTTSPTIRVDTSSEDVTTMTSHRQGNDTVVDFEALNLAFTTSLLPTIAYIVVLMVVGLVGNTVVLVVYYRRFKPSASRTYILAMSLCDLLANALSLPSEILDIRFTYTFDVPLLCSAVRLVNSFLALASAFILVAVARDRYNKICHPLATPRSHTRIRVYILVCCLASLALSVVFFVLNGSHALPTGVANVTGVTCSVDDAYVGTLFPLVYNLLMALAFISCVVIMAVSYTAIALTLWRHKHKLTLGLHAGAHSSSAVSSSSSSGRQLKKGPAVADDTSSGARSDSAVVSEGNSSSGKEAGNTAGRGETAQSSDKRFLLLDLKNPQYEGPGREEVSDEGCFSACSEESGSVAGDGLRGVQLHPQGASVFQQQSGQEDATKAGQSGTVEDQEKQSITPLRQSTKSSNSQKRLVSPQHKNPPSLLRGLFRTGKAQARRPHASFNLTSSTPKRRGTVKAIPSSTTLMMFVLTAVFVVNYLPHLVIISVRAVSDDFGKGLTGAALNAYNIGLRSYFMNCAVNSLVYGFCSARFRLECRQLFRRER